MWFSYSFYESEEKNQLILYPPLHSLRNREGVIRNKTPLLFIKEKLLLARPPIVAAKPKHKGEIEGVKLEIKE